MIIQMFFVEQEKVDEYNNNNNEVENNVDCDFCVGIGDGSGDQNKFNCDFQFGDDNSNDKFESGKNKNISENYNYIKNDIFDHINSIEIKNDNVIDEHGPVLYQNWDSVIAVEEENRSLRGSARVHESL